MLQVQVPPILFSLFMIASFSNSFLFLLGTLCQPRNEVLSSSFQFIQSKEGLTSFGLFHKLIIALRYHWISFLCKDNLRSIFPPYKCWSKTLSACIEIEGLPNVLRTPTRPYEIPTAVSLPPSITSTGYSYLPQTAFLTGEGML